MIWRLQESLDVLNVVTLYSATSPDDINIEIHRSEPVVSCIEMEIPCINSHVDILINFGGVSLNYIISINRYFLDYLGYFFICSAAQFLYILIFSLQSLQTMNPFRNSCSIVIINNILTYFFIAYYIIISFMAP